MRVSGKITTIVVVARLNYHQTDMMENFPSLSIMEKENIHGITVIHMKAIGYWGKCLDKVHTILQRSKRQLKPIIRANSMARSRISSFTSSRKIRQFTTLSTVISRIRSSFDNATGTTRLVFLLFRLKVKCNTAQIKMPNFVMFFH